MSKREITAEDFTLEHVLFMTLTFCTDKAEREEVVQQYIKADTEDDFVDVYDFLSFIKRWTTFNYCVNCNKFFYEEDLIVNKDDLCTFCYQNRL
jgi:hypothetical protein